MCCLSEPLAPSQAWAGTVQAKTSATSAVAAAPAVSVGTGATPSRMGICCVESHHRR